MLTGYQPLLLFDKNIELFSFVSEGREQGQPERKSKGSLSFAPDPACLYLSSASGFAIGCVSEMLQDANLLVPGPSVRACLDPA